MTTAGGRFVTPAIEQVRYGPGSRASLYDDLSRLGAARALVVTTGSVVRSGVADAVESALGAAYAGTFDACVQHVSADSVLAAAATARDAGADAIVSVGGGSAIDTAKVAVLCLARGVRTPEQLWPMRIGGPAEADVETGQEVVPHIALSTTLSGAEFTGLAGVTDRRTGVKSAFRGAGLTPAIVVLDAELATRTPGWLWGTTGMRAVDHAVETICSVAPMPFADALCLEALRLLGWWLPRAAADDADEEARHHSQLAMWLSIYALPNVPQGASHAIGHQLGARCGVPHGVCSAIMLPWVMEYNLPASSEAQARIAVALGAASDEADTPALVRGLAEQLDVPLRLRDWGVDERDLPDLAGYVLADFMGDSNPRPIDQPGVLELLRRAY